MGEKIIGRFPNLQMLSQGCVSGRISEWPRLKPEAKDALALIDRLTDLVRYARDHFYAEKLISDEEFAALVTADGPKRVERLQTYDEMRAEIEQLRDRVRAEALDAKLASWRADTAEAGLLARECPRCAGLERTIDWLKAEKEMEQRRAEQEKNRADQLQYRLDHIGQRDA